MSFTFLLINCVFVRLPATTIPGNMKHWSNDGLMLANVVDGGPALGRHGPPLDQRLMLSGDVLYVYGEEILKALCEIIPHLIMDFILGRL